MVAVSFSSSAHGDPDSAGAPNDQAIYYLEGWLHERERLQHAECTIVGRRTEMRRDGLIETRISQHTLISPGVERHRTEWEGSRSGVWLEFPDRVVEWCYGAGKESVVAIKAVQQRNLAYCRLVEPRTVSVFGNQTIPDSRPTFRTAAMEIVHGGKISAGEPVRGDDGLQLFTWSPLRYHARQPLKMSYNLAMSEPLGFLSFGLKHTSRLAIHDRWCV